jgi:hypothetical protein
MESQQDNAAFEAWAAEQDQPDGHPIIATIIGVVVIFIGVGGNPRPPAAGDLAALFGGVTGVALLVWGVAFAITIRHASTGWKIGSFAILWVLCLLATSLSIRRAGVEAFRHDVAALTEVKITTDGKLVLPKDGGPGSFSHISMTYLKAMSDESAARDKALIALGFDRIADVRAIVREPALLRDCDRFSRARPIIDGASARMQGHSDKLMRDLDASDIPASIKVEMLRGIEAEMAGRTIAESNTLSRELLEEGGALCSVLARRHWRAQGRSFAFTNTTDLNSYNAHIVRWNDLSGRARRIQAEGRASMAAGQQEIRDAISR